MGRKKSIWSWRAVPVLFALSLTSAMPVGAEPEAWMTLPNLAPLPPYDVFVGESDQPAGPVWSHLADVEVPGTPAAPPLRPALRFTTTIQNRGEHPFELLGLPEFAKTAEDPSSTRAYQCVKFGPVTIKGARRDCQATRPVGALEYHAEHRHMHIEGFGRYELRRDVAGRPDMSGAGLVSTSDKIGWCVSDMYRWRDGDTLPPVPVDEYTWAALDDLTTVTAGDHWYGECSDPVLYQGASWRQGISPGWADTYPALYTGQEIPIAGVPDGVYWIVTTINPRDNPYGLTVRETTWDDNASASKVQLYDGGRKARLLHPVPASPYGEWYDNPEDQPGD